MSKDFNEEIKQWWDKNSFTYGLSKKKGSYRDVGNVPDSDLDKTFFDNYNRKIRKNFSRRRKY